MLGGGMRQTGILAAAGILALTDMTRRLAEDHANARLLAQRLAQLPGVSIDMESVQINMVFAAFDWPRLPALAPWLRERGVLLRAGNGGTVRFVTHHGIDSEDIERVVALLTEFHGQ